MEQTLSKNLQLGQLVANALSEIERLGYSRRSRNRYRAIWEHLIEFSGRNQLEDKFSADLAARFLDVELYSTCRQLIVVVNELLTALNV